MRKGPSAFLTMSVSSVWTWLHTEIAPPRTARRFSFPSTRAPCANQVTTGPSAATIDRMTARRTRSSGFSGR